MSRLPDRAARRDLKTGYLYQVAAGLTIAAILSAIAYARQHTPGAATKAKPFLSYIRASYNVPLPLWVWLLAGGLVISVAIFSGVRYFERRPASPAVIDFMSPGEFA